MDILTELASMNYPLVWILTYLLMPFTLMLLIAFVVRLIGGLYKGIKKSLAESANITIPKMSSLLAKAIEKKSDLIAEKIGKGYKDALMEVNGMDLDGRDPREALLGKWFCDNGDYCFVFQYGSFYVLALTRHANRRTSTSFIRKTYDCVDKDIYQLDGGLYETFGYLRYSDQLYFPSADTFFAKTEPTKDIEGEMNISDVVFSPTASLTDEDVEKAFEEYSKNTRSVIDTPIDFDVIKNAVEEMNLNSMDDKSESKSKTSE